MRLSAASRLDDDFAIKPRGPLNPISGTLVVWGATMPDIRRILLDHTRSIRSSTSQKIKTLLTVLVSRNEYPLQPYAANQTLIWNLFLRECASPENRDANGNGVRTHGYTVKGSGSCCGQTA
jgi:hypothetical protein